MWWNNQNLHKPRTDKAGAIWHFKVWHDLLDGIYIQRIYFWDDQKKRTGVLEFKDSQVVNATKLKDRIRKLLLEPAYRRRFYKRLRFPVERYYS